MFNINVISECEKHKKFTNLVVLDRDVCMLSCPQCFIQTHKRQERSNLLAQKGIFICESSIQFFKQWTISVVGFFKSILAESSSIDRVINFASIPEDNYGQKSNIIAVDQASRIINAVLQEQIAVFQGNLTYVSNQNLQELTHHIFLMDLYNMVMFPPQKTLELILDKFKKTCQAYYKILRLPLLEQKIQDLQFSHHFVDSLNQITKDKMLKYGEYFFLNLSSKKISQFKCFKTKEVYEFPPEQPKIVEKQQEAISQYEDELDNQSMKTSEIVEKKIVIGHDKEKETHSKPQFQTPKKEPKFDLPEETAQKQISIEYQLNIGPQNPSNFLSSKFPQYFQKEEQNEAVIKINTIIENFSKQNQVLKGLKEQLINQIQNISSKINEMDKIKEHSEESLKKNQNLVREECKLENSSQFQQLRNQYQTKLQQIEQYKREMKRKDEICRKLKSEIDRTRGLENEETQSQRKGAQQMQTQTSAYKSKITELEVKNLELTRNLDRSLARIQQQECKTKQFENKSNDREKKLQSQVNQLNNINQEFIKLLHHKNEIIEEMESKHEETVNQIKDRMNKQFQILHLLEEEELNAAKKEILELQNTINQIKSQLELTREEKNKQGLRLIAQFQQKEEKLTKDFNILLQKTQSYQNFMQELLARVAQKQRTLQQLSTKMSELGKLFQGHQKTIQSKPEQETANNEDKSQKINSEVNQFLWNLIIEQLHTNIAELTTKYSCLEEQLMKKDKGFQELNVALEEERKRNQITTNQSNRLCEEITILVAKNKGLEAQLQKKQEQQVDLNLQLVRLNEKVATLQKNQQSEEISQKLEIEIKKTAQLQEINKYLASLEENRDQQIQELKQKIYNQEQTIKKNESELLNTNKLKQQVKAQMNQAVRDKDELEETNQKLKEQLNKLLSEYSQLKQSVQHLNQQITQIKQIQAKRDEDQSQKNEKYQRQSAVNQEYKSHLEQKIQHLQQTISNLEEQARKQAENDDELLEQLINAESESKAKQFQIDRLLGLYYQILGQIDEAKRNKYIEAVARYKPARVKTQ